MCVADPVISIIVPVYNAKIYLSKCIDSILSQTFNNWELLLVDDGSTDYSPMVCDKYAIIDKRVRVFHRPNSGVTSARAEGVRKSKGEYITFVDADDTIATDMLESMLYFFSDDIDIVAFEYRANSVLERKDYARELLGFRMLAVWGKVYRKRLFDERIFEIPHYFGVGEDFLMQLNLVRNIRGKVLCRTNHAYFYNMVNPNSVQRAHYKSYEYEKRMVLKVADIMKNLPRSFDLDHAHFKWNITYLGGMVGLQYKVDYNEEWILSIQKESEKYPLTLKERCVIAAIHVPICRLILIGEKRAKILLRKIWKRYLS